MGISFSGCERSLPTSDLSKIFLPQCNTLAPVPQSSCPLNLLVQFLFEANLELEYRLQNQIYIAEYLLGAISYLQQNRHVVLLLRVFISSALLI